MEILIRNLNIFDLSHIKLLDLSGCGLTDKDWNCFVENISEFYEIFVLKLGIVFITNLDYNYITTITTKQIN
jgi:hypothetical protein